MSLDRLANCFERCRAENRAALVGFLTAGDPNPELSTRLLATLARHADIVEIGMPFSDPMADGPVIQAASERALAAGTHMDDVFRITASVRKAAPAAGIVLMGYGNTAYATGFEAFASEAALAGADGVLLVDVPVEESAALDDALAAHRLHNIRLIAPTSTAERRRQIASRADGFIYYVSLTGITGAEMGAMDDVRGQVEELRRQSGLPVCVGFGIKTPEQAAQVAGFADGVVVGSALVEQIPAHLSDECAMIERMDHMAKAMRAAMERGSAA